MVNDYQKEFCSIMERNANGQRVGDVFADWCRAAACAVSVAVCKFSFDSKGAEEYEAQFAAVESKYKGFNGWAGDALGITCMALSERREEFLGHSLEKLGMGNKNNGQFFTPNSVADLMGRINADGFVHTPGDVVKIADPACGASVCMISGAEALLANGVPQRDIFIEAGDIDRLSCDISLIQLNYLGYAAVVNNQNALTLEQLEPPRYTIGYFLHGMNYRRAA